MRKYIDQIAKSLKKNELKTMMIIIQLTVSILLLFMATDNIVSASPVNEKYKNTYSEYNYYYLVDPFTGESEIELYEQSDYIPRMKNFLNTLNEQSNLHYLETILQPIYLVDGDVHIEQMDSNYESGDIERFQIDDSELKYRSVKSYRFNQAAFDENTIGIWKGRGFSPEDYIYKEGKTIPILMDYKLREQYMLGEILGGYIMQTKTKFEIIGFTEENSMLFYKEDLIYPDYTIIVPSLEFNDLPLTPEDKSFQTMIYLQKMNGTIKSKLSEKDVINIVKRSANANDFPPFFVIGASTINLTLWQNMSADSIKVLLFVAVLSIIFSAISLSSIILMKFRDNFSDYGVHLLCGANIKHILSFLFLEVIIIVFTASLLGALLILILMREKISAMFLIVILGVFIFETIVSFIGPYVTIKRYRVSDFFGGNE